jgi:hypothetical protein
MPEVILSYDCAGFWDNPDEWETFPNYPSRPIDYLYDSDNVKLLSGAIKIRDHRTGLNFQRIKSITQTVFIRLDVSESSLISYDAKLFQRIDGNHRLTALENSKMYDFQIPYCIILLSSSGKPELNEREKIEMELFHLLNSKSKPLAKIEQYRGFLNLFSVSELEHYGRTFSITREYLTVFGNTDKTQLRNIACFFNGEKAIDMILTCVQFLIYHCSDFGKTETEITASDINTVLLHLDNTYFKDNVKLCESCHPYTLLPYVYYCYQAGIKDSPKMDSYTRWFISNRLYEVKYFDASSIIGIFNKIYELRQKTIFVAMPFIESLNFVFEVIKEVVTELNNEYQCEIPSPIRIDKQITGSSYDIIDEILKQIENAGLLIADLTQKNANVYYEAGFALGLIRAKGEDATKILFLVSNPEEPDKPFADGNLGFDLKSYKAISYTDDGNGRGKLKSDLTAELKAFYMI